MLGVSRCVYSVVVLNGMVVYEVRAQQKDDWQRPWNGGEAFVSEYASLETTSLHAGGDSSNSGDYMSPSNRPHLKRVPRGPGRAYRRHRGRWGNRRQSRRASCADTSEQSKADLPVSLHKKIKPTDATSALYQGPSTALTEAVAVGIAAYEAFRQNKSKLPSFKPSDQLRNHDGKMMQDHGEQIIDEGNHTRTIKIPITEGKDEVDIKLRRPHGNRLRRTLKDEVDIKLRRQHENRYRRILEAKRPMGKHSPRVRRPREADQYLFARRYVRTRRGSNASRLSELFSHEVERGVGCGGNVTAGASDRIRWQKLFPYENPTPNGASLKPTILPPK
eukprot:TRINITY_DN30241_c0_g1_i2.p1 TRINITY_DN30241_c0_g1~~TRINITY_DN30241_c0_g1_i2.p1  ORF type:complete len:333 (+),score=37.70 TRINITY_DN30241_c0_g1_i2:112-1110(+)